MVQSITDLYTHVAEQRSDYPRERTWILDFDAPLTERQPLAASDSTDGTVQAKLVERCLQGDESAFALIVDQFGALLMRTAYLLVQDEETAKDIVQDSFFLAWKNIEQLREPALLRAWLLRIVVNQATSLKRQWARRSALLRQQLSQQWVDQEIRSADLQRGLIEERLDAWQALQQLPLNQRVVVVLFYYHRMTMPEIARLLSVSENTLRKRLQSALEKMRKTLSPERANEQQDHRRSRIGLARSQRDE